MNRDVEGDATASSNGDARSPLLAITTHHEGRSNGLVAATGVFASLVPEAAGRASPCPILADTLTYIEARVIATLDAEELTIFLADVIDGGRHRNGEPLTLGVLREHLPKEWLPEWAVSREPQTNEARRRRGLR